MKVLVLGYPDSHNFMCSVLCSHPWDSPGRGIGSHSLLQGIFTIQVLNPGLPRWQILYHMNHQGSPSKSHPSFKASVMPQWKMGPVGFPRCVPFSPWGLPFALPCELQGCVPMKRSLCIYTAKSIFKYWDKICHGKRYRFLQKTSGTVYANENKHKMCRLHGWQRMQIQIISNSSYC